MDRSEREIALHKIIYKDYIERRKNPICGLVDQFWYGEMMREIVTRSRKKKIKIIDLGAGTCLFFETIKNNPNIDYTGVDSSQEMLNYANSIYGSFPHFHSLVKNLDGDFSIQEPYDAYVMRSLVHHLDHKDEFLKMLISRIPSGALLVISEPNRNFVTHALRELLKKIKKGHFDQDHYDLSAQYFLEHFKRDDISLLGMKYFGYLSYPFSFPYILKLPIPAWCIRLFIPIDRFFSKLPIIRRLSWHVIYIAQKK